MLGNLRKYLINIVLIVVFTFTALYFALRDRLDIVTQLISAIEVWDVLFIGVWAFAYVLVGGTIITKITRSFGYTYSYRKGIVSNFVALFFAGITPSASGGQIGQMYIFKKQGVDLSDGGSILWYDFIVYQGIMIVYVLVLLLLRFTYYYTTYSNLYILILIGFFINSAVIVFLITMALFPQLYMRFIGKGIHWLSKTKLVKHPEAVVEKVEREVTLFKEKIKLFKQKRRLFVEVVVLNIVKLTVFYSIPISILIALQIPLQPGQWFDVIALTSFVSMANSFFPVPGASGGTESVFTLIFSNLFGINLATAIMLIWRFATYYLMLLLGGLTFLGFKLVQYYKYE
ncbi:MAG: lysylphosphatidylglycerol synthase transmembrane domain-containing protein [Erysipelotrichaceae bacterium]